MADLSEHNEPRPSLETEAVSGDEGTYDEIKIDPAMLDPSILNPPNIPNTLGAEDIDKVIAALSNVPDVSVSHSPKRPSKHKESKRKRYSDEDDRYSDDEDRRRKRRSSDSRDRDPPVMKRIPFNALRGRGRGRLRVRARGTRGRGYILEQARGLFAPVRSRRIAPPLNRREEDPTPSERGTFPVARGRNIFPEDEEGGRGRGRFVVRENALFKRFKQQHRMEEQSNNYDDRKTRSRSRSRSRSRTRSISSRSNSRSSSSSSGSSSYDSDDSRRERKKKKKKDKKKKKKKDKKKKKIKEEKESDEDDKNNDWRISMLQKMKNIKNLPPEQLEMEFKKAMAEKKRKEEEEKCLEHIKQRQKFARKVKKEAEKAEKKKAKEEEKKKKVKEEAGDDGFYAGFTEAMIKTEAEAEKSALPAWEPVSYPPIFKSSFSELPTPVETEEYQGEDGDPAVKAEVKQEQEDDPYLRALEEHNRRKKQEENADDMMWPAGAIEDNGVEHDQLTKEEMDAMQEQDRKALEDRAKTVMSSAKMFSKVRNRIKSKPLKINLKMHVKQEDEEPGLQPVTGENTPGEGLSEGEKEETWYDDDLTEYDLKGSGDDNELVRRMERIRRKKEVHDPGELEDGEHCPSPEMERPHLRRRRQMMKSERRDGTPLMDEKKEQLEEGEIDNDATPTSPAHAAPWRTNKPPPAVTGVPPPPVGAAVHFIDTSVPPPNLVGAFPPAASRPPSFNNPKPVGAAPFPVHHHHNPERPPPGFPPVGMGGARMPAIPPPVPYLNPEMMPRGRGGHRPTLLGVPPPVSVRGGLGGGVGDYAQPVRDRDNRYDRRSEEYDRRDDRRDDRRSYDSQYDRRGGSGDGYGDRNSRERSTQRRSEDRYGRGASSGGGHWNLDNVESDEEPSKGEEGAIDITKITPIMKYIAKHLEESKQKLEMRGPFAFNVNSPGLSKHLFVAFKMVEIMEGAGYDQSKMYMQAMFPGGLNTIKTEMIEKANKGILNSAINGPKLVKMCVRCIKCFIAYFSGNKEDLASSEDEDGEVKDGGETKTVNTSLSAILGRIKETAGDDQDQSAYSDPLSRVLTTEQPRPIMPEIPDTIENHWGSMDTQVKADNLKSFTQLQNHFTKQLMSKGADPRDAREEAADCMMCLVVTGWSDDMLKQMVSGYKKTILPEQAALEERRTGQNRTLYDQMVDRMLKHQQEFPYTVLQQVSREDDPKEGMKRKVRNVIERMLRFYMRGIGKVQEGRDPSLNQPAAPGDYQFNYIPDGLREDEVASSASGPNRSENNFFNMEAATVANRSFSAYNKRTSIDDPGLDLEPVSPDNGDIIKGALPKKKYLFGTLHIDTIQFRGANYVYEIGLHMSDTSSCEISIIPTNLYKQRSVLEMLGFSFNPEEGKFIYVKPGGGFQKSYSEQHGLDKVFQFLKEKRYESRGDSKNSGLVLTTQTTGELATWDKFVEFHKMNVELDRIVAGYGVLDLFTEESMGALSYVGPKLNREPDKTFFTWEYHRSGNTSENMAATKAASVLKILEDLLGEAPDYENFIKVNCFPAYDSRFKELRRKEDIINDLYNLECCLSDALNERNQRRKIYTSGVFCASSTADLGDRPGLVAARFIRFLVDCGLSKPALKDRAVESRERGTEFLLPLNSILDRMHKPEERDRCRDQMVMLTRVVEQYILNK